MRQSLTLIFSCLSTLLALGQTNDIRVRPWVFFTQDRYEPGDSADFRVVLLAHGGSVPFERAIYTAELISSKGSIVSRQLIPVGRAGTFNRLFIPHNLTPGKYTVRLYSLKMSSRYGYQQTIQVGPPDISSFSVDFFPEGGRLVAGVPALVCVRLSIPGVARQAIFEQGDERQMIEIGADGFGEIQFVPTSGSEPVLRFTIDGKSSVHPLPAIQPSGPTLRLLPGSNGRLVADIRGIQTNATLYLNQLDEHLFSIQLEPGSRQIAFDKGALPEGYSDLVLLDSEGKRLAHRPVYTPPVNPLKVSITGLPQTLGQRTEPNFSVQLQDAQGSAVEGNVCISVVPANTVSSSFLSPDPVQLLMFDQAVTNLEGSRVLALLPMADDTIRLRTRKDLMLTGRVELKNSKLPDSVQVVLFLHKDKIMYDTWVDKTGRFAFRKIFDFNGDDVGFFRIVRNRNDVPGASIVWDTAQATDTKWNEAPLKSDNLASFSILRKDIAASYSYFLKPATRTENVNPNAEFEDEFQHPDVVIQPSDYVPFESMEELFREVVPNLEFRKRRTDSTLRVVLVARPGEKPRYAGANPLLVIDGCLSTDLAYLMQLQPADVISVGVTYSIPKLNELGSLAWNGIVYVQTRRPEQSRLRLSREYVTINGLTSPRQKTAKPSSDSRIPDLRTHLLWIPFGETHGGKFEATLPTGDVTGRYVVRILAIARDGRIAVSEQMVRVVFIK